MLRALTGTELVSGIAARGLLLPTITRITVAPDDRLAQK
jgi:hypothetical protein